MFGSLGLSAGGFAGFALGMVTQTALGVLRNFLPVFLVQLLRLLGFRAL